MRAKRKARIESSAKNLINSVGLLIAADKPGYIHVGRGNFSVRALHAALTRDAEPQSISLLEEASVEFDTNPNSDLSA
ncbi:uncharacterized protein EAE98_003759 [Botrytis deweyae]|uniref:Uncharacterized protein n=1 Tax=Botrytis deweyae TaxID=2478750 RepID=A0ABQ7IRN1_9HELO|nr:uncharacterized protein EAE98_003759 [Botrytis deweyae]KAF7932460.1 hypothetical protein EAE98_003759 [Botrytis deweyae]